jgi:hypothetical protein
MNPDNRTDPNLNKSEHTEENIIAKRIVGYGWYPASLAWERIQVDANGVLQTNAVLNVASLSFAGVTTVFQGGAPWTVLSSIQGQVPVVATLATLVIGQMPTVTANVVVSQVFQGGAPWLVNASVQGTVPVSGFPTTQNVIATIANASIPVTESGAWNVTATIGNTVNVAESGAWGVTATIGNIPSVAQSGTWGVNASLQGIPNVNASIQGTVPVSGTFYQALQPVQATLATLVVGLMPNIAVNVSQVFQGSPPWLVNASIQGIPNVNASIIGVQNVIATVLQGTSPWLVNASIVGQQAVTASIAGTPPIQVATIVTLAIGSMPAISVTPTVSTVVQGALPWVVTGSVGATQLGAPWTVSASVVGNIPVTMTVATLQVGSQFATVYQAGAPWLVNASIIGNLPVTMTTSTLSVGNTLNAIVTVANASIPVTGTFWQANQPVTATLATLVIGLMPNIAVSVSQVFQGGAPWTITGSVGATQLGAPWTVNASIQGIPNVNASIIGVQNVIATVLQGTNPWLVQATIGIPAVTQSGAPWTVNASVVGLLNVNATQPAPWNVNASIIGVQNVMATVVNNVNTIGIPATSGGLTTFQGNLNATTVTLKSLAGQVYGYHLFNSNATQVYVNFYNASIATVGLTSPFLQLGIPASGGATWNSDIGIAFSAPIMVSASVSVGGVGAPGVSISTNVYYK